MCCYPSIPHASGFGVNGRESNLAAPTANWDSSKTNSSKLLLNGENSEDKAAADEIFSPAAVTFSAFATTSSLTNQLNPAPTQAIFTARLFSRETTAVCRSWRSRSLTGQAFARR